MLIGQGPPDRRDKLAARRGGSLCPSSVRSSPHSQEVKVSPALIVAYSFSWKKEITIDVCHVSSCIIPLWTIECSRSKRACWKKEITIASLYSLFYCGVYPMKNGSSWERENKQTAIIIHYPEILSLYSLSYCGMHPMKNSISWKRTVAGQPISSGPRVCRS